MANGPGLPRNIKRVTRKNYAYSGGWEAYRKVDVSAILSS